MKIYITKWALTKGILEADAEALHGNDRGIKMQSMCGASYFIGDEWHTNLQAAIKRAEGMRKRKLKSLRKQIERIKSMKFDQTGEF